MRSRIAFLPSAKYISVLSAANSGLEMPGAADTALCEFFPTNELNGDYSNWWSPNLRALLGLIQAAGFKRSEVLQGPPPAIPARAGAAPVRYRAIVHAYR